MQLVEFANVESNGTKGLEVTAADSDGRADVMQAATPEGKDPADYGANEDGAYWMDGIQATKSYTLQAGGKITTHTHGIVIIASDSITIDGTIAVRDQGAAPGNPGYATSRAGTLSLYRGYGATDDASGEPVLWGSGSPPGAKCEGAGGGYIILNAPVIHLNGDLDAGSACGQAGIVYLEGNVDGAGTITASLIIHRGTTA